MRLAGAAKAVTVLSLAFGAHAHQQQRFGGAPLRFRGALVYVSPTAVEVLEQNSLVIGALLPKQDPELAGQLAAHAVGDEVEITTVPIQAFYDSGTRRSYLLKLDGWRTLGRPKPAQLQAAMDSRARLEPGNLLAPPPGATAGLPGPRPNALPEATRAALGNWIQSFPNYLADATEHYDEDAIAAGRVRRDVLTYTATVADGKIARG
ncbi:MAG TPA: hypothetical protein VN515_03495, partial [Terriglobales bacterium]|nr:hypothetical protein [Terriglobales bacterium]